MGQVVSAGQGEPLGHGVEHAPEFEFWMAVIDGGALANSEQDQEGLW